MQKKNKQAKSYDCFEIETMTTTTKSAKIQWLKTSVNIDDDDNLLLERYPK